MRRACAQQATNPFNLADAAIQHFVYDGDDVVLEFDNGSLAKRFLNGPAVDIILAQEDVNESISSAIRTLWGLIDDKGSVTRVLDNTGTVVNQIDYNSFGRIVDETHPEVH